MTNQRIVLYNSLKAIFLHIDNAEKAFLNGFNLSVPRFYLLMHIYNHPGINYMDLTDLMLCTKSNTTRIVRSAQEDGLLNRKNHPNDGRSYQLFLTDNGKRIFEQVYPAYLAYIDKFMSLFNNEEIAQFVPMSLTIENTLAANVTGRFSDKAKSLNPQSMEALEVQAEPMELSS